MITRFAKKEDPKASRKVPTRDPGPEAELLLCCARSCIDSERANLIRAMLRKNVDWTYLLQTASRHAMLPRLFWSLNTVCSEAVPKDVFNQLRDYFRFRAQHNLFLTGELLSLLRLFEIHGISAIPFKGPTLAAFAYDNLALREFGDLDILFHRQDVLRAKDLLISQGYRLTLTDAQEAEYLRSQYAVSFICEDKRVVVDVHWGITAKHFHFPLDFDSLWQRLQPLSLAGTPVPSLPPEELLLLLCVHGTRDMWERLQCICDVAELIRAHQEIKWERAIEQADMLESKRMLFLGLLLASDLLGTTLPENVRQTIQTDPVAKILAAQMSRNLFRESDPLLRIIELFFFHFRVTDGWRNRVLFCLYRAAPNLDDQVFLPLPTFLSFLYYLIRPIRLVSKFGLSLLKYLFKACSAS